jgi:transcriptional regulator with XRE-family HTH domain
MPKTRAKPHRTQFFTAVLETLMDRNGINQVTLSQATGIAVSRINNYLHGKYRTIRPDHLASIAKAVSRNSGERGEIAQSYVMDLLPEELHRDLKLEVTTSDAKAPRQTRTDKSVLSPAAASVLERLAALSARSSRARERIQQFAEVLEDAHSK